MQFAMQLSAPLLLVVSGLASFANGAPPSHHHGHGGFSNSTSHEPAGKFTFDQLWDLNQKFWTSFVYPNNVAQAKSINSTLFADDIQGRIDLTRTFDGPELNTEYGKQSSICPCDKAIKSTY